MGTCDNNNLVDGVPSLVQFDEDVLTCLVRIVLIRFKIQSRIGVVFQAIAGLIEIRRKWFHLRRVLVQ